MRRKAASIRPLRTFLLGAATLMVGTLLVSTSAHASTFTVTTNSYNGAEWWGTITFKNNGPTATSSYKVEFDVPAGVHCTAEPESIPAGATLSPLAGDGSRTLSNHCVFTWSNSPLSVGQSKTFNYSTDSQHFNAASNVVVTDTNGGGAQICSTFAVTKNVYDRAEWWGTITFKNNGPYNSYNYKVEFDVPAGKHCTNDYVPPGATLSPLNGTGSSARTVSNHCVYSWSNASPVAPGSSKTFNYSTDSQNFSSASNVQVSDASTCTGGVCIPGGGDCTLPNAAQCCSGTCSVVSNGFACTL